MRRCLAHLQKGRLDLGGEYIDAADDQHVVGTSGESGDTGCGTAAGAGAVIDAGQILGAVAD